MFKKFFIFNWIKSIPSKIANAIKNIPTTVKSVYGWIKGIYRVFVMPFIKRACAFVTAYITSSPITAK